MRTLDTTTAAAIKTKIRSSPIIPGVSPQVLCEWNMNNVFFGRGFNDFGGGNDLYSTMYGIKERVAHRQPMMQANSFAKPWRETNNIRSLVAVSTNSANAINTAYKAANGGKAWSIDDVHTYATDSYDGAAFRNWISPRRSIGSNEVGMAGAFPSGGRNLDVKIPRFMPPKRYIRVHGVMKNTASTNDLFLLSKDKVDKKVFAAGNYLAFDHTLGGGPFVDISTNSPMLILNSGVRNVTEPVAFPAKAGTKVLTFAGNTIGLLRTGLPVTIGSFTTTIASWRRRQASGRKGVYWLEIILKDALPSNVQANKDITFTFNFIRVRHYASARTIVRNFGITDNIVGAIITSSAATSAAVNKVLSDISYTGGGGVKFTSNITLTEPLIIPPNVLLDFTGRTITYNPSVTDYPYMAYFGNSRTNVTGVGYSPSSPTTLTLAAPPATNIQQSLIAGAKMALRVVSVKLVGTVRKVIETRYTFTVASYTLGASQITIKQPTQWVPGFAGATGVMSLAPNEATAAGNNIIIGGTWNAQGTTSINRGHFSMANTHFVWISSATLSNASNNHSINVEGCTNIKISGITQTNANHTDKRNDPAGVYLTSHNFSDKSDACDNIQIYNSTFSSVYGIRGNVDRASVSEKNTNISIKNCTLTGANVGVDLTDCDNTAIQGGTITGTSDNAIQVHANLGTVTNNYISGVTTAAATAGKSAILLSGANSDASVVRTTIYNNTLTCAGTSKVVLEYTAYIIIANNAAVATTANIGGYGNTTTGCARLYYNVGTLPTTYMITNVEPTTQYVKDRAEVLTVKQTGEKIVITLERALESVRVGDYLMLVDVNLGVDGPKKVMRLESTNPKTPWVFDKITLASTISQTLQNPTGTPVELNPDDDIGYACTVQEVPVNKITAKFETSYGTPKTAVVQVKSRGTWTTVYNMASESELSDEDEIGDAKVDNIKTLNIYYNGSAWTTTKSYFNPAVNQNIVNVDAVRMIIDTTTGDRQYIGMPELSARLVLDATDYVTDFNIDKELADDSKFAPIGRSSTNTGSVSFLNDSRLFDQNYTKGPLYQLFKKNCVLHFFVSYTGVTNPVKLGTMLVDEWSSDGRDSADAKLVDKSLILQNKKCQDIFFYNGNVNSRKTTSVKDAIITILDSVSFGNYVVYGMDDFEKMKFIWTKKEDSPWKILQDIAEVFQISLYFDEVGRLHIMSKGYLYAPYFVRIASATSGQNKITITGSTSYGKADLSKITPGMLVTEINATTGVPRYERIPADTVVMAVGTGTLGNEVILSNNTVGTQGGINVAFGRLTDYDIIGGFVGDRLVPAVDLESSGNDYNFNVQENVPLINTTLHLVGQPALDLSSIEQNPTCTQLMREPDFYTYSYSNSGTVATLVLVPAHNDVPAPVNGSALTVSGLGSSFDGAVTLTSVSAGTSDGISYTVTYSMPATAVLTSSEEIGTAHYTNTGVAGWKAKSLSPSTQYTLSGWAYSPNYSISISPGSGSPTTIDTADGWKYFSLPFTTTSTETERLVTFTPTGATLDGKVYLYNMQVTYSPTDASNIVEGGYDEVLEASQKKLDSASKIIVKYKNVNLFKEGTTGIAGALQDVGKNAVLWEPQNPWAIPTFIIKEVKNGYFKFDASGMNENADPEFGEIVVGESDPIEYSGVFEYKDKTYRYAGLEAFAERSAGTGKAYMFMKNADDRARMVELNDGLPPKFTGKGQLKKNYPEVFPNVDPNTPPSKTIVPPGANNSPKPGMTLPIVPGGPGLPLNNDRTQWIFWETGILHDSVGTVINIDKMTNGSNRVGLVIYGANQPNLHSYVIGFNVINTLTPMDRANQRWVKPYAQVFSTTTTKTKANKPQLDTRAENLKVEFFNANALTHARVMQNGLKLEVVSYKLNGRMYFDFYVYTQLVATYSDEIRNVTGRKNGGVFFDKGTTGYVQAMYAIRHPEKLTRKQWIDPATLVDNQIDQMKKKLQDACNKYGPYARMTPAQKKAFFDKKWMGDKAPCQKAAANAGNWQWPAYLTALRKQGAQVVRRDER